MYHKIRTPIIIVALSFSFLLLNVHDPFISSANETTVSNLTPLPLEIAGAIAEHKLSQLGKEQSYHTGEITSIYSNEGEHLCYFIPLIPSGYMVVSAYYELPAIIAYSFTSQCPIDCNLGNQFITLLQNDLTLRITHIDQVPDQVLQERRNMLSDMFDGKGKESRFEQWPAEGTTPTEGWVETNWHQNAPYNNFCPIDGGSGQRSLAGCPSVAMAQIVHYHTTINDVSYSDDDDYYHNYGGNQFWIDNDYIAYDFPSFPQLNSYLYTLSDHYNTGVPLTDQDKAALTFACGVAAQQVYNPSGSGTFGVDQAYDAYLKFNFSTVELLYETDPDLYTHLSDNIKNATPAHLAIVNQDWTAGHNLVVDGYNTDEYYHLNFGWGGSYDGWYLLPDELPYELTIIEGIIVDILPENTNHSYDINQPVFDRGFPVRHALDGDWAAAQSFIPTLENLTWADIYLRKFGTPEFDLTVELREDDPQGTLIETLVFIPDDVPSSWEWFALNFTDIMVSPGTDYFIVLPPAPSGVTTSFGYEWGYAFGNQYDDGAFWFTRDSGELWRDLPTMYEFCFRTYG